jgi:hypothetical protein
MNPPDLNKSSGSDSDTSSNSDINSDSDSEDLHDAAVHNAEYLHRNLQNIEAIEPRDLQPLRCKYVPDGELFVPVLTFRSTVGSQYGITHLWTSMDAYTIQHLISKGVLSILCPVYGSKYIDGTEYPPIHVIYYGLLTTGFMRVMTGDNKLPVFRRCLRRRLHRLRSSDTDGPTYLLKMINGIVVPFNQDDIDILFHHMGYSCMFRDICETKKYDELAPSKVS